LDPETLGAKTLRLSEERVLTSLQVANKDTGVRGILDDLLRRLKQADIVLAPSDHGFIEPPAANGVDQNDWAIPSESIFYRYSKAAVPVSLTNCVNIEVGGEANARCVGRT
jgi:hypothetical protein